MNNVPRMLATLALAVVTAAVTGCTFGTLPPDSRTPATYANPPCSSVDVCGVRFDGGLVWSWQPYRNP